MSTEASKAYVIASSKEWHRDSFDTLENECRGEWYWVSTPEELVNVLQQGVYPRYIFFMHWSHRVPSEVWMKNECVCFHMTDLPYGRGGSPLQNLILRGHDETVLTAFRMVEEMDAGPVYAKSPLSLSGTAEQIYLRAGELSAQMIRSIVDKEPEPEEQQGEPVLFQRRKPEQSELPVRASPEELYDFIRMLDAEGYPHAFTRHGELKMTYTQAELMEGELTARVTVTKASHGESL